MTDNALVRGAVADAHGLPGASATIAPSTRSDCGVYLDGDRLYVPGASKHGEEFRRPIASGREYLLSTKFSENLMRVCGQCVRFTRYWGGYLCSEHHPISGHLAAPKGTRVAH